VSSATSPVLPTIVPSTSMQISAIMLHCKLPLPYRVRRIKHRDRHTRHPNVPMHPLGDDHWTAPERRRLSS